MLDFFFFFSDLSGEGNSNTKAMRSTTQATDGNLLKLQDRFEIGLIKILVPIVDEKELIHFLRIFKYGNY